MAAQYIPIKRISSLDTPIKAEKLDGSLFTTENQAHEFIISVRKNGVKQTVTGSVSGKFIRANGITIFLQGSIVDGDAVVRLHQDCYNVQGRFTFNIFNTQSGVTTCIYSAVGKIDMGSTETVIDAGDVVPDVSDVVAAQEAAQATINAANAAAQTANTAAQNVGSIVARPYSSSSTYTAGDYCTNNGNLYKANQDISTAEEWTASHWTQIVMGDEVASLKSALTREETRLGEYDKGVFVFPVHWERGTINTSSGADQANNYRIRSDRVYYEDYSIINITIPTGYSWYVFAYDGNDAVVGKQGWNNTSFGIPKTLYTGAVYLRYIIQVTAQSTTVVPMNIVDSIKIWTASLSSQSKTNDLCYVSTNGSDTNIGTKALPFATIQKGITEGFHNICVLPGDYVQSVSASGINGLHIFADNSDAYTSYTKRKKPTFLNGTTYTTFQTDGAGYKYFALVSVPSSYTAVFISHTQDPIITGSYPSYRASLWANHSNKYDDFRVKPVLTYEELAENNTFYYDGTNVYFNISDTLTGVTVSGDTDYIFNFAACDELKIEGICILYGKSTNLRVLNSNSVSIKNCEFGYTMRSNCVTADYSNVIFDNCEAFKATIDGFNSHYYGVSVYNNCRGMYNYDDGESSHEYCEVIVNGGEFAYNGKGGHAPVNGCKFKCHGTYTHNNNYGFYLVGNSNFELEDILISDSVAMNNATYDLQNTIYSTKIWNSIIGTRHISSGTVTDLSA